MSAQHLLLDSPSLGHRAHLWRFSDVDRPLVVFPSATDVAHEWQKDRMIDALDPLMTQERLKIYCPETNVSHSFTDEDRMQDRMTHHRAYERFVMETLVPFIRKNCRTPDMPIVATGCSVGALYTSLFVLKYPETFHHDLCLSNRYRTSKFFDGTSNDNVYFSDPLAFVPNLDNAALDRMRRSTHLTIVVGRNAHEHGCIPETAELDTWLQRKQIPNHVAF